MKIIRSISQAYSNQLPIAEKLKQKVDSIISRSKKESWHYYSRIKSEESYALKVETSRVSDPSKLEDFFACTIVVENISEIKNAISMIEREFKINSRRPKTDSFTHKDSHSFQFDDLRLYCCPLKVDYLPDDKLTELEFELQVKTFLQHAWSIATHDLIYKSHESSWPKERVAFQIKAMLEQAEISISGADSLAQLPELAKNNTESENLKNITEFLKQTFSSDALPKDILRMARIVNDCLKNFQLRLPDLKLIIEEETKLERGAKTLNLSPYGIIIQSIINQRLDKVNAVFKHSYKLSTKKIFIPSEIDIGKLSIEDGSRLIRFRT